MKIKGLEQFINIKSQGDNKVSRDMGFKEIFEKTISGINTPNPAATIDSNTIALQQGDKVLNLLDRYIGKLSDHSVSLKEIHPLVERIEKAVSEMQATAENASTKDRDVNRFLNDIAVTANVAMLKYQRGDFIS